jgi:hypothetical protein
LILWQNTEMSAEVVFQAIEAIAVVVAVGFAILQVRQYRRDKHREAAMELLHSFQSPSFARALNLVYAMTKTWRDTFLGSANQLAVKPSMNGSNGLMNVSKKWNHKNRLCRPT